MARKIRENELTCWVPRAQDDPSIHWVLLDLLDHLCELVDSLSRVVVFGGPVFGSEMSPLEPVHGPEISLFAVAESDLVKELSASVAVPDLDVLLGQEFRIGRALDEPEQLFDDATREDLFRRQEGQDQARVALGRRLGEGEAELWRREERDGARPGAVRAFASFRDDPPDQLVQGNR